MESPRNWWSRLAVAAVFPPLAARGLALCLCFLAGRGESAIISNLLVNPGFEEGSGIQATGWTLYSSGSRVADTSRSGSFSAKAESHWSQYSGIYQLFPANEDEIWRGEIWGMNPSSDPIGAGNRGYASIAFFDNQTNFLSIIPSPQYVDEGSPLDQWVKMSVEAEAPAGAVHVRFLPVYYQPGPATGSVRYDDAAFGLATTTRIQFAGRDWDVWNGSWDWNLTNNNAHSTNSVFVDTNGWLHLKVQEEDGISWVAAVESPEANFGYGEYRWYVKSRLDQLDTNIVLGLFTYAAHGTGPHREIDIEVSRQFVGGKANNLYYTVQPYYVPQNTHYVGMSMTGDVSTHRFIWREGAVDFQSYYGHTPEPEPGSLIQEWTYTGSAVPQPGLHVFMNLWRYFTLLPETTNTEVIITDFIHVPCIDPAVVLEEGDSFTSNTCLSFVIDGFNDCGEDIAHYYVSFSDGSGTTNGTVFTNESGVLCSHEQDATNEIFVWAEDVNGGIGQAVSDAIVVLGGSGDFDGDGLPNDWEQRYGHDPLEASDQHHDADSDGMGAYGEYIANTDPLDMESVLHVGIGWLNSNYCQIVWTSDSSRYYQVESAVDLGGPYALVTGDVVGLPPVNTVTHRVSGVSEGYYRVSVRMQDD